jgi:hypothetical protein
MVSAILDDWPAVAGVVRSPVQQSACLERGPPMNTEPTISAEPFHYAGFASPAVTGVPDELFDVLMPELTDAELRVLLYIVRRTFGFKRASDDISLRQMAEGITTRDGRVLDRGAGVSKATVARALRGLEAKGVIVARRNRSGARGNEPTTYALRFRDDPCLTAETSLVSRARHTRDS